MRIYIFLLTTLQHRTIITEMKAEIKDLQRDLLRLTHNSIKETHKTHQSASHDTFMTPPAPGALQQSQYGTVKYWTKVSWQDYVDRAKDKNSGREPTWTECITDEKGVQMSKQRHKELWEDAKIAWNSLYYRRLDPTTWSKKHTAAADYFYNTILKKYPEFQLCDGNWKLQMWATKRYSDWTKNVRGGGGLSRTFPYYVHFILFYSLFYRIYPQGADPSIVQVGEKRPSNGAERQDKASKKARPIKKETAVKQEKLPPPAPGLRVVPPVICPDSELIILDDESDSDILEYVSDSDPVNVRPILQSSHRSKTAGADLDSDSKVRHMKSYTCIHSYYIILGSGESPNVGWLVNEPATASGTYINYSGY